MIPLHLLLRSRSNKCKISILVSLYLLLENIFRIMCIYICCDYNNGKQQQASYPTLLSNALIRGNNHLLNGGHLLRPSSGTIELFSILSFARLIAAFRISNLSHPRSRNNFFLFPPQEEKRVQLQSNQPSPARRCRFVPSPRETFLHFCCTLIVVAIISYRARGLLYARRDVNEIIWGGKVGSPPTVYL